MHILDEIIESLQGRYRADIDKENFGMARLSSAELLAYRQVREGKAKDETIFHHADELYTYRQAWANAEAMLKAQVH